MRGGKSRQTCHRLPRRPRLGRNGDLAFALGRHVLVAASSWRSRSLPIAVGGASTPWVVDLAPAARQPACRPYTSLFGARERSRWRCSSDRAGTWSPGVTVRESSCGCLIC